jgi:hypothetical protein
MKLGESCHSERSQPLVYSTLPGVRTRMNRRSLKQQLVEGLVTYDFTPHSSVRDHAS